MLIGITYLFYCLVAYSKQEQDLNLLEGTEVLHSHRQAPDKDWKGRKARGSS